MDFSNYDPKNVIRALRAASVDAPRRVRMSNPHGKTKYALLYVIDVPRLRRIEVCVWLDGTGWWFEGLSDGLAALNHAVARYEGKGALLRKDK